MTPMPAVLMKIPSPLPLSTTLVSPVTSCTPAALAASAHAFHHRAERLHRKPFLQDETRAQVKRPRAAHGQVVDRAVHRQVADRPAGKHQRPHDVGISGERQALAVAG